MRKYNSHHTEADKHLSLEDLQDYTSGRLILAERHRIDLHLIHCQLCADALRGVSRMNDPLKLVRITHELQASNLRKKTERKRIIPHVQLISIILILMMLMLIVFIGLYYFNKP